MTEREEAVALANRVLDKPFIDPDGDICLLARQFLRALEEIDRLTVREINEAITEAVDEHGNPWFPSPSK